MKKLAIIITHPIHYYVPVFQLMHQRGNMEINVFYTLGESAAYTFDTGFNQDIAWDTPLTEGYPFEWVDNTSETPGSRHFKGIVNPGLTDQVEKFKPNAILVFGWAYSSHLKAMRHFKGKIPVYFRGDSTLLDEQAGLRAFFRPVFLTWVYQHIDHAFYVGLNNKAYFKFLGVKESQLTFAGHAIDNQRFSTSLADEALALRNSLGLKHTDALILFAGKFSEKKDPLALIAALSKVSRPGCHLLFAGSGEMEQVLKEKTKNAANIHFIGFKNHSAMPAVYQACNIFCLPSRGPGETWGFAVNEAMASGKAVLVSDKVGCAADLVKENYNGAIFKSGDEDDLAQKLNHMLRSPIMLNTYGSNSMMLIRDYNFLNIIIAIETKLLIEK